MALRTQALHESVILLGMLQLQAINKSFHDGEEDVVVLDGVDLTLQSGESLALLGDSGSGKSTLLQIAAGLEQADTGRVLIADHDLGTLSESQLSQLRRRDLGFVFQQFNLIPGLDVLGNILFQRRLCGLADADPWPGELIDGLDLRPLLERSVEVLSGGQQQRVAIARALAHQPKLVFADEPTGNLHDALSRQVMSLLNRFVSEAGAALLLVTHNRDMAAYAQRQCRLSDGRLLSDDDSASAPRR